MYGIDFVAILPGIIVAAAALLVVLQLALFRMHAISFLLAEAGLLLAFLSLFVTQTVAPLAVGSLFMIDQYSLFFMAIIFVSAFIVAIFSFSYLDLRDEHKEEFYIVLLLAVLGSVALVSSTHFVSFFLGLELLTVSLYVMIAYFRSSQWSLEAGTKYLLLAAASSAFLLFGMALIYAELGTMEFSNLLMAITTSPEVRPVFVLMGTGLLLTGVGFKLAVVPFHMWTPDVYEGAPAPVTAFVATVSKGAIFALLLRYFVVGYGYGSSSIMLAITVIAIATMFIGNLLALMQKNIKRLLAYSSIAHLGYLLVAFIAGSLFAVESIFYYWVVYFIAILGSFGIVSAVSGGGEERSNLDDYRGLFWKRPLLSVAFTAMLLSLAGIPLTGGFIGKFFVLMAGVESSLWALVVILVINSTIGLYYYLRVVVAMFSKPLAEAEDRLRPVPAGGQIALTILTLATIYFGVYPAPVLAFIKRIVLAMG